MSSERIVSRKGPLLLTQVIAHLHLAVVVDGVLVSYEVVGPGEFRVARFARGGVEARAPVRRVVY